MAERDDIQKAVGDNFEAFQRQLPELMKTHSGKFVLMRDRAAVEFFDTARDAVVFGNEKYKDRRFSVQQITGAVVDLGYFSHAVHVDTA